ncbi:MAG: alpha/beta hydrolase [Hyphomicrobiales bacterium]
MEPQLNIIRSDMNGVDAALPPVLLVHGAWHGAWCWQDNFLDYFASNGHETCAIDLRGHGNSPAQKAMRWNRVSDYVDDVLSVVETFEHPPIVIGHSMGGFVCQHLMARTNHLSGVGLLASAPHYGVWDATLRTVKSSPLSFLKANMAMSLYPLVSDPNEAVALFLDEDVEPSKGHAFASKLGDESYFGFLDMLFLNLPKRPQAPAPVCVIGGVSDKLFSPSSQQAIAKHYDGECHIIDGASHNVMMSKHWEKAAETYLSWMKTLS